MSHVFQSSRGLNWEDLDDDNLKIFAHNKEEGNENGPADIYHAEEEAPTYCLSLARMKYDNAVWDTCRALPAHPELSHSESFYYPLERVQYHTNWRDLKVYYGADMYLPMLFKSSPLKVSLTWNHGDKGGYNIDEEGKLVLETDVFEEEPEQLQASPRSPSCVPGMRCEDEPEQVCCFPRI